MSVRISLFSCSGGESVCGVRSRLIQTLILNRKNQFVLVELTLPALLLFYFFFFFFKSSGLEIVFTWWWLRWGRPCVFILSFICRPRLLLFVRSNILFQQEIRGFPAVNGCSRCGTCFGGKIPTSLSVTISGFPLPKKSVCFGLV